MLDYFNGSDYFFFFFLVDYLQSILVENYK